MAAISVAVRGLCRSNSSSSAAYRIGWEMILTLRGSLTSNTSGRWRCVSSVVMRGSSFPTSPARCGLRGHIMARSRAFRSLCFDRVNTIKVFRTLSWNNVGIYGNGGPIYGKDISPFITAPRRLSVMPVQKRWKFNVMRVWTSLSRSMAGSSRNAGGTMLLLQCQTTDGNAVGRCACRPGKADIPGASPIPRSRTWIRES